MKAKPFKIRKTAEESFNVQEDIAAYFYDYLHTHPEVQITLILKSSGTCFIGNSIGSFEPGEIYIIGSQIPHIFKNSPQYYTQTGNNAHCLTLFFKPEAFGATFFNIPELQRIKNFILKSKHGLKLEKSEGFSYQADFTALLNQSGYKRFISFLELLHNLARNEHLKLLSNTTFTPEENEDDGKRLNDVISYITNHYTQKITVDEIAAISNLSTPAFCRYFKVHTRKSFITYLNEYRIGIACQLLLSGEKNVAEICYLVGFNNVSNFNRQFKSITGTSPSKYSKQHR